MEELYHIVMTHNHSNVFNKAIKIGGKNREITVYTEYDQKIHRDISNLLWQDYKKILSPHSFAYTKGKSPIDAITDINNRIHHYDGYIRTDIKNFFPSINKQLLQDMLCKKYPIDFIVKILSFVFVNGDENGLAQGSALSPMLSNIYLTAFDNSISSRGAYYRYSDDILLLCHLSETESVMYALTEEAQKLNLQINSNKTHTGKTCEGFHFLGFQVSVKGTKAMADKLEGLEEKLQRIANDSTCTLRERIEQMRQSIIGWQNYYQTTYQLSVTWYSVLYLSVYGSKRDFFTLCQRCNGSLSLPQETFGYFANTVTEKFGSEAATQAIALITGKTRIEFIDILTAQGHYSIAQNISSLPVSQIMDENTEVNNVPLPELFANKFINYDDEYYYASQVAGVKEYLPLSGKPDAEIIQKHLNGKINLAISCNMQMKSPFLVFDIDIDKGCDINQTLPYAISVAKNIKQQLEIEKISSFIVFSGHKGYHVWAIFNKLQPISELNQFALYVLKKSAVELQSVNVEIFPNVLVMGEEKQNIIKLPLGINPVSFQASYFLDEHMNPVTNAAQFLTHISTNMSLPNKANVMLLTEDLLIHDKSKFPRAYKIYVNCKLVRHVVNKGIHNSFLGHYERKLLSYIFPAIGDEGKLFVHYVMKGFLNYSYAKTEKFLKNSPPNAVSCPRIKKYLEAELGQTISCNCHFDCDSSTYPTPVLHAGKAEIILERFEDDILKLAQQLMEANKRKKETEKLIAHIEYQLDGFFKEHGIQEYALPIGTLKKNSQPKPKWSIELE